MRRAKRRSEDNTPRANKDYSHDRKRLGRVYQLGKQQWVSVFTDTVGVVFVDDVIYRNRRGAVNSLLKQLRNGRRVFS